MNHRLTQILSRCLAALVARDDLASGTVVIQHMRVIDRKIVEPAVRVIHRVTTAAHYLANETVGVKDGGTWLIHKPCLHLSPLRPEPLCIFMRQRPDRKLLHSRLPLLQFPLSLRRCPSRP